MEIPKLKMKFDWFFSQDFETESQNSWVNQMFCIDCSNRQVGAYNNCLEQKMIRSHANSKKEQFKQTFEQSEANYSQIDKRGANNENTGRPIQLIKIKPTGKIEINQQALAIIASVNEPVGFVSLVGKTRTGKSCLLNRLLGIKGDGFKVDSSTSSCTEGIWMWSVPFENKKYNNLLFFIDTEGTDSLVKDPENDTKIFTLAVLISSFFIYNSIGNIDQRSISDLQMVTALSKKIKVGDNEGGSSDPSQLNRFMPKFLWLLRDFMLKIEDEKGRRINSNTYLQNCLIDQNSIGKTNETSRKIKKSILTYFPIRQCVTLVRPVDQEDALYDLNKLEDHRLRRQFIQGVNLLRNKIIQNTGPKIYGGKEINGYGMSVMIEQYVEAFNAGGVPNIKSAWEQIAQDQGNQAYNRALQVYEKLLEQQLPGEEPKGNQIYKILGKIRNETLNQFKQQAGNNLKQHSQQLKKLQQFLDSNEKQILLLNQQLCVKHNNLLIYNHSQKLRRRIQSNYYTNPQNRDELGKDIEQIQKDYMKQAKGEKSGEILAQFITAMSPMLLTMKNTSAIDQAQVQRQKALAEEQYNRKIKLLQQQNQSMKNQLQAKNRAQDVKDGKVGRRQQNKEKKKAGCCAEGCQVM